VGRELDENCHLLHSRAAFNDVFPLIERAVASPEGAWITILDAAPIIEAA
jgi:hypothetical protein